MADCAELPWEVFYGVHEQLPMSRAEVHLAKSICYGCPVRVHCLLDAVDRQDPWGVQGGLTGPERQRASQLWPDRDTLGSAHADGLVEQKVVTHRG